MRERGEPAWCVPTWLASRDCLMGVQLGFMGVQLGGKVIWAGLGGCGCGAGLARNSGRLSLCFPDD